MRVKRPMLRRLPITGRASGCEPKQVRSNSLKAVASASSSSSANSCRITWRSRSSSSSGKLLCCTMSPSMRTNASVSRTRPLMWKALWSLSVWALTCAPSRSASRLMRWQSRSWVPLNAMCSTMWLMPLSRALSCWLPVCTTTLTSTVCRCGVRMASTRTPLSSVISCVSSSPWLIGRIVAAGLARTARSMCAAPATKASFGSPSGTVPRHAPRC